MTVYLVILEDRHEGVLVEAFENKDDALNRAKEFAAGCDHFEVMDLNEDWLLDIKLSDEGDCVRVEEATVQ